MLNGGERLIFDDPAHQRHVDVFLDVLRMCHTLDFRRRLTLDAQTLPVADLLLSKLQIIEMTERDVLDTLAILRDQPMQLSDDVGISLQRLTEVCGGDWGWWRTSRATLEKLSARSDDDPLECRDQILRLREFLRDAPKSPRWRARAIIGEHKRWYGLPEEVR